MREQLEKIIEAKIPLVIDKAKVLTATNEYCKVQSLTNGKIYFKCTLNASEEDSQEQFKVTPAIDSEVVIGVLPNNRAFIISYSVADKFEFKKGTTVIEADSTGITLERDNENLLSCIKDLITEVKKIVVIYGNGPDVPALTEIETRFNKILN